MLIAAINFYSSDSILLFSKNVANLTIKRDTIKVKLNSYKYKIPFIHKLRLLGLTKNKFYLAGTSFFNFINYRPISDPGPRATRP